MKIKGSNHIIQLNTNANFIRKQKMYLPDIIYILLFKQLNS